MYRPITIVVLAVLLAACAVAAERTGPVPVPPVPPETGPADGPAVPPAEARAAEPPPAADTEPVPPPRPVTGEAPAALIAQMRADLEKRLAAAGIREAPVVVSSEEVEWPDGGMGCGRPGEMYTMMIIPGYRVVFGVGSRRYAYHASRAGAFKYCDSALRLPPPSAGRGNPTT